jgi:tripartite-type tricarboxylate transporter receptor subunit TctC
VTKLTGAWKVFFFVITFGACQASLWAQPYPSKAIRFVVPAIAGGGATIVARVIGENLSARWKQPIVIDNRTGAAGVIGADIVAKSKPDGYTMLLGFASGITINPFLYKLPYKPIEDFAPVTLIGSTPLIMVLHPSVPAKTVKEFIAFARARPHALNYSSSGNGSATHLAAELFKGLSKIEMTHIPYKGSTVALTDVIGGQVAVNFSALAIAIPHVQSGRLHALGVTSSKRTSLFPELPTIAEGGLSSFEVDSWYGVLYPADTPSPIIDKTYTEIKNLLQLPDIKQQLVVQGIEPVGSTPAEFSETIKNDLSKWAKVMKHINMQID